MQRLRALFGTEDFRTWAQLNRQWTGSCYQPGHVSHTNMSDIHTVLCLHLSLSLSRSAPLFWPLFASLSLAFFLSLSLSLPLSSSHSVESDIEVLHFCFCVCLSGVQPGNPKQTQFSSNRRICVDTNLLLNRDPSRHYYFFSVCQ